MFNRGREPVVNRLVVVLTLCVVAVLVPWTQRSASASPHPDQANELASLAANWQTSGYIEIVPGISGVFTGTKSVDSRLGGLVLRVKAMLGSRLPGGQEALALNAGTIVSCDKEANVFHWRLTMPPEQANARSNRRPEF
jgi:hypothetical protein